MTAHFGPYGGRFVSETLIAALEELEQAWQKFSVDKAWRQELDDLFTHYAGRPTPLTLANRLTEQLGGAKVFLKREDLLHTGAHKLNNCLGQALLAKRMGKQRIIAETGAGQHGVATATVAAKLGFPCEIFMGAVDAERQKLNVHRMKLLGAKVHVVHQGTATLKDAMNEALRHWVTHIRDTHYIIGSVAGPHPYPTVVRDLQAIIGQEAKQQMLTATGRLPDVCIACVGGGSNAMGLFHPFVGDASVELVGVEAQGTGTAPGEHAATLTLGRPGVLHGSKTYVLSNQAGQILPAHSIAAGLDYPGVGPEHAWLKQSGRARYETVGDEEALAALTLLARSEGIICALETAHAVAYACRSAKTWGANKNLLICLSGRGDKDMPQLMARQAESLP